MQRKAGGERRERGRIAFSYKFMRAALQAAAGKSGKPGLYPQEFASFQRSFEERLAGEGPRRTRGGSRKAMRWVSRGGPAAHSTYLLRCIVIYALSHVLNDKRTDSQTYTLSFSLSLYRCPESEKFFASVKRINMVSMYVKISLDILIEF